MSFPHALLAALVALMMQPTLGGAEVTGADLVRAAVALEEKLPCFSALEDNAIGADDANVASIRVFRQLAADGGVRSRVELGPTTERGKADPARFTKTFLTSNGRCYLLYRGKAIAVDPALPPTYAIGDFMVPPAADQQFTVATSQVLNRPCTRVTQTFTDAKHVAVSVRYDIDTALGIIIAVNRSDGGVSSYTMTRSDVRITAGAVPDTLFLVPIDVAAGTIGTMDQLLDVFKNGIP